MTPDFSVLMEDASSNGDWQSAANAAAARIAELEAENERLRGCLSELPGSCYLDDNALVRRPFTTVSCEWLRKAFALLES